MAKKSKRKILFITLVLTILLISSVFVAFVPNVHAAETTIKQEGVAVTSNVIGVDVAKYTTVSKDYQQDLLYLDVLPQETLRYTIEADGSKLDIYYTFVNGKLQKIHVLDNLGSPQMQKAISANALDMSKDFLINYQEYSKNAFYGELKSTLDTVDANKNVTATFGNMKLSVTEKAISTTFRWVYTFNGIEAPDKCVALKYENGFLKYFIDNWDLYKIGSTTVNVSEEQAIDIGMSRAMNATWSGTFENNETFVGVKYNVTGAMVWKTVFANSLFMDNPRDQDPLMLYPMRHIWVSFDKFYPCYVYGMNVYVWADAGEIGHSQERFSTMDPPADLMVTSDDAAALLANDQEPADDSAEYSPQWNELVVLSAFAVLSVGTVTVYSRKKKSYSSKIGGALLCILMGSTAILTVASSVSTASALPLNGRAVIWGSESSDSFNPDIHPPPEGSSWRKKYTEVDKQQEIAAFIQEKFDQNSYSAVDYQGTKGLTSNKGNILGTIWNSQYFYLSVAAVDFDHGNGLMNIPGLPSDEFHYIFEDQRGTMEGEDYHTIPPGGSPDNPEYAVYDYEIYDRTEEERYFFVLINACNSANIEDTMGGYTSTQGMVPGTGRALGMPFAWSHGTKVYPTGINPPPSGYMSGDGYAVPDSGDFCYIGFVGGSAALIQDVNGYYGNPHPYWWWVEHLFAIALTNNWSVKQALDEASQDIYDADFGEIPLHETFDAIWPMYRGSPPEWHNDSGEGQMVVYGNSNVKLYQQTLTLSASGSLSPTFTIDGQSQSRGTYSIVARHYDVNVGDVEDHTFSHLSYKNTNYDRPANILIDSDGTLKAHYTCTLTVTHGANGDTDSSGEVECPSFAYTQVQAIPDPGYKLDHWELDGSPAGNSEVISVWMGGDRDLHAVFSPDVSYKYVSSIDDYEGAVGTPEDMVGWQPEGQYAVLCSYWPYGVYGWVSGELNAQASGHIYMYGYGVGYGYLDVYVSSNGYNWYYVSSPYVSGSPGWIDCGTYGGTFNYVKASVSDQMLEVYIDSVKVT
ncbi:hypothetical protein JW988_07905 [Candidatus Bathyarchaeota archaeon]|nr:hypothetical protein [Candidatus Bathyarchaeota archaeon]